MDKLLVMVVAMVTGLAACSKDVDKAAKRRIFSPEAPSKVVASSAERLASDQLANDSDLAHRVLGMGAAEATERLGPHEYTGHVKFQWAMEGQPPVELDESRTLKSGRGGVSGDFVAAVQNSHEQGLEVMRVGGQVFAKNEYGKFRQRLRDRGMAEREREEVFGALAEFDHVFLKQLKLVRRGVTHQEGRSLVKYTVGLSGTPRENERASLLPKPAQPKNGMDAPTQRRMRFLDKRQPTSVSGEVWVDEETAVVLHAKLNGTVLMPASSPKDKSATLTLSLDSSIRNIGQGHSFAPPKEFLPDEDKPKGIAVALQRFGFSKKGGEGAGGKEPEDEGQ